MFSKKTNKRLRQTTGRTMKVKPIGRIGAIISPFSDLEELEADIALCHETTKQFPNRKYEGMPLDEKFHKAIVVEKVIEQAEKRGICLGTQAGTDRACEIINELQGDVEFEQDHLEEWFPHYTDERGRVVAIRKTLELILKKLTLRKGEWGER